MRRVLREIWPPVLLAALTVVFTALDAPYYGPHSLGSMYFLGPVIGIAFFFLGMRAARRKQWYRLGFYVLALAVCVLCWRYIAAIDTYCPECRA